MAERLRATRDRTRFRIIEGNIMTNQVWVLCKRAGRTTAALAKSSELPRWAKVGLLFAALPIPGPFDEIAGAIIVFILMNSRHRATVKAEWVATS